MNCGFVLTAYCIQMNKEHAQSLENIQCGVRVYWNTTQALLLSEMSAGAEAGMNLVPSSTVQFRKVLKVISYQFMFFDYQYLPEFNSCTLGYCKDHVV